MGTARVCNDGPCQVKTTKSCDFCSEPTCTTHAKVCQGCSRYLCDYCVEINWDEKWFCESCAENVEY